MWNIYMLTRSASPFCETNLVTDQRKLQRMNLNSPCRIWEKMLLALTSIELVMLSCQACITQNWLLRFWQSPEAYAAHSSQFLYVQCIFHWIWQSKLYLMCFYSTIMDGTGSWSTYRCVLCRFSNPDLQCFRSRKCTLTRSMMPQLSSFHLIIMWQYHHAHVMRQRGVLEWDIASSK